MERGGYAWLDGQMDGQIMVRLMDELRPGQRFASKDGWLCCTDLSGGEASPQELSSRGRVCSWRYLVEPTSGFMSQTLQKHDCAAREKGIILQYKSRHLLQAYLCYWTSLYRCGEGRLLLCCNMTAFL